MTLCVRVSGDAMELAPVHIPNKDLINIYANHVPYRDLIKFCVRQLANFSKLHQIYQDIFLNPTVAITPSPNCDIENFWLLVK